MYKAPVKSSPPMYQHPTILLAGCPFAETTESALNIESITLHPIAHSRLKWGPPSLSSNGTFIGCGLDILPVTRTNSVRAPTEIEH